MVMRDDEVKYKEVIGTLKQLQQVKAPQYFEADLMRRINDKEFEKTETASGWRRFFLPSKLIPSAGLAAAAVFFLFVFETGDVDMDNPLLADPRIREDVTANNYSSSLLSAPGSAEVKTSDETANEEELSGAEESTVTTVSHIKSGLNFRQIQLNDEERAKLNQLRQRVMQIMHTERK